MFSCQTRILFQYRIFEHRSFRRILGACGFFVVVFEIASTLTFILECIPVKAYWLSYGSGIPPPDGGRCINIIRFLLVNGSINTVTDFSLLLLVIHLFLKAPYKLLTRTLAIANDLESTSQPFTEMHPDYHLRHWSHVRGAVGLFPWIHMTDIGFIGSLLSVWYGW